MNNSTAIFLINSACRVVKATYQDGDAPKCFKTLDQGLKKDDLILVQTDTRHKLTVCKIVEVDVDFDPDTNDVITWVFGKVDMDPINRLIAAEEAAVKRIKTKQLERKRAELAKDMAADDDEIKKLPLANIGDIKDIPALEQ